VLFAPVAGMGDLYLAAAIVLGGIFTIYATRLVRDTDPRSASQTAAPKTAMRLFTWSISYITLLFGAMALDQLIRSGL
jgi:protoheme IX farnesyltransferase